MILSLSQWVQYLQQAGFNGVALATAAAISLREAGTGNGQINTAAVNPSAVVQNGVNYGQAAGPFQFLPGTFSAYADPNLPADPTDPQAAAAAAFNAFQQTGGFFAWAEGGANSDCPGQPYTVPTSPGTVIGCSGPIPLPANFASVTGYTGGNLSNPVQQDANTPTAPSSPLSGLAGLLGSGGQSFLQNAGVGVLGLVILLGGFLILAAPTVNTQVVQPTVRKGTKAAVASVTG